MIIVTNTAKITKGNGHKLIERFNKVGQVETMPGFLGLEVLLMQKKISKVGRRAQHLKMLTHIKAGCQNIFLIIKSLTTMLKLYVCQWLQHSKHISFLKYRI